MVLDEPGKDDTVFSEQGISFMVENNLLERVKPIKIDFVDTPMGSGFIINSSLKKKKTRNAVPAVVKENRYNSIHLKEGSRLQSFSTLLFCLFLTSSVH